ncbi:MULTISPECIES: phosphonate metabolism protein/1,5-bisphosphokinase (PRPP-forming) PhnN [Microvirga]|uniref:phosphonate metabolism protein/1,5-bisphosphokinase (PRPP-forming) PhnN n=1 Tax=Microvirga TaxID=186650 RepID=UPI001CFD6CEB|nr:phosphonate metabolism protein/1,5-bisphosphokinase (PRPP-forming) PhnN [Microvirga lenta]MCB5173962.1 phosphonate metabolism protein/1,5-bisphosphokinase (PRPP-forming) PhnN [Microvirga lenta]
MTGGFVFVVGPSGAGKDTLLALAQAELSGDNRFLFPRRLVTRSSSAWEEHDTITEEEFEAGQAEGRFTLSWKAHGHGYALPGSCLQAVRVGCLVVCNISRTLVDDARRRLPNVAVVEVTAPRAVLAERLAKRNRTDDANLEARLARSSEVGPVQADLTVVNDRSPEVGAGQLIAFLRSRAMSSSAPYEARSGLVS